MRELDKTACVCRIDLHQARIKGSATFDHINVDQAEHNTRCHLLSDSGFRTTILLLPDEHTLLIKAS